MVYFAFVVDICHVPVCCFVICFFLFRYRIIYLLALLCVASFLPLKKNARFSHSVVSVLTCCVSVFF